MFIYGSGGSLDLPLGIAFDNQGNLWVAKATPDLVEFSAGQLTASGSYTPVVIISEIRDGGVAFNSPPVAVPIYR